MLENEFVYLIPLYYICIMQWKLINKNYKVSENGDVMSIKTGKYLKPQKTKDGYLFMRLCVDNVIKTHQLSRLVAQAFIPNPNNYPQVDHINEIKTDNRVLNLQWLSVKDNTTKTQGKKIRQITNGVIKDWISISYAADTLGFNKGNIHKCLKGIKKQMYGSKWEYIC